MRRMNRVAASTYTNERVAKYRGSRGGEGRISGDLYNKQRLRWRSAPKRKDHKSAEIEILVKHAKKKINHLLLGNSGARLIVQNLWGPQICWNYCGRMFQQLVNSYNVNLKIIYDLPRNTHCWIIASGLKTKQIFSIKAMKSTFIFDVSVLTFFRI